MQTCTCRCDKLIRRCGIIVINLYRDILIGSFMMVIVGNVRCQKSLRLYPCDLYTVIWEKIAEVKSAIFHYCFLK